STASDPNTPAVVFGDRRMIASHFAPDAVLETADSTFRRPVEIANALAAMGASRSLRAFRHLSLDLRIVDSTAIDSGRYTMRSKRPGADSLLERGVYVARWRIHAPPLEWMIKQESLRPANRKG